MSYLSAAIRPPETMSQAHSSKCKHASLTPMLSKSCTNQPPNAFCCCHHRTGVKRALLGRHMRCCKAAWQIWPRNHHLGDMKCAKVSSAGVSGWLLGHDAGCEQGSRQVISARAELSSGGMLYRTGRRPVPCCWWMMGTYSITRDPSGRAFDWS